MHLFGFHLGSVRWMRPGQPALTGSGGKKGLVMRGQGAERWRKASREAGFCLILLVSLACFMPYLPKTRWIVMAMKRGSTRGEAIPEKLKQDGAV